jgi:hypothetical protein
MEVLVVVLVVLGEEVPVEDIMEGQELKQVVLVKQEVALGEVPIIQGLVLTIQQEHGALMEK